MVELMPLFCIPSANIAKMFEANKTFVVEFLSIDALEFKFRLFNLLYFGLQFVYFFYPYKDVNIPRNNFLIPLLEILLQIFKYGITSCSCFKSGTTSRSYFNSTTTQKEKKDSTRGIACFKSTMNLHLFDVFLCCFGV